MIRKALLSLGLVLTFLPILNAEPAPIRIASGTVGTDEILLKLLAGEESRLVAVSLFAENPRYSFLEKVPSSIKGRVGGNIESLLMLKPDLVFLASYTASTISEQLKAAKVRVHVQKNFRTYADIQTNITEVGRLIQKEKEAGALVAEMDRKVEATETKRGPCTTKPTFLQYVASGFVPGRNTIIDDIGERAGYQNVLRKISWEGWTQMSDEVLATQNPDVIFASAADAPSEEALLAKLRASSAWQKIDAVKKGRIIRIPDRLLYTVSHHAAELLTFLMEKRPCFDKKK